jgi:hypothetical protein
MSDEACQTVKIAPTLWENLRFFLLMASACMPINVKICDSWVFPRQLSGNTKINDF